MENIIIFLILIIILLFIRKKMINYSIIKEIKNNDLLYIDNDIEEGMYDYSFWKLDESIILNNQEIDNLNEEIDCPNYHLYKLSDGVLYGLVVKQSELRKYPNFEYDKDKDLDKNLLTIVDYGSGLIILDDNEEWYYVRTKYYEGWILKNNVGIVSKEEMNKYIDYKKFVRIISNKIMIDNQIELTMGCKIPLLKVTKKYYKLLFIDLDYNGNLRYIERYFLLNSHMVEGNILFNKKNIIKQALKTINEPYIWGNADCSSLIQRIFMCFGIYLPRDSYYQSLIQSNIFDINNIETGDMLFSEGHVMLFLGDYNNKKYIIHSSYGKTKIYKRTAITLIDEYKLIIKNYIRF